MARPSLEQATQWLEDRFDEVYDFDWDAHPPRKPYECPNGAHYCEFVGGRLRLEGDGAEDFPIESDAIDAWYGAVCKYYDLLGGPRRLWWRIRPEMNTIKQSGRFSVYSRLAMTNRGPHMKYTGKPIKQRLISNG